MDSDEENVEEIIEGPLDEDGQPHGCCTITYSSSDRFEGHFVHGEKNGRGKFYFFDGSTLEGFYVDDALQGQGIYTYEDGGVLHGTYMDGELNGPAQEYDSEGVMIFKGQYKDNNRHGECWVYYPVSRNGTCKSTLKQFKAATLTMFHLTKFLLFQLCFTGPLYTFDKSTSSCISTNCLLPDPYETMRVYVADSLISNAGEGLFAKTSAESNTVLAFYNGIRITHHEVDCRDWSLNGNTISLDEETVLDVPYPYNNIRKYCASLGHKANHSFTPNCMYDTYVHPRFGPIKCIRTVKAVEKDEELTVAYGYDHYDSARSGLEAPEWYKKGLQSFQADQKNQEQN
ncbi:histone-lysine N-methyltransferase SETD7 [Erpetoichthys calabaricus]|uniref:histone-lysine N-methyltransferase SETD7 n=1 Tax=Erpetoichthys calabaricus TaxID=27687 RepID=UPI002234E22A|nr:histone-lysine N-methyltransferase SETD7 [Erpetoichthys calabaricus]